MDCSQTDSDLGLYLTCRLDSHLVEARWLVRPIGRPGRARRQRPRHTFPAIGLVRQNHRQSPSHRRSLIRHVVARRSSTLERSYTHLHRSTPVLSYIRVYKHDHVGPVCWPHNSSPTLFCLLAFATYVLVVLSFSSPPPSPSSPSRRL